MKRLSAALFLLLVPGVAFAFDAKRDAAKSEIRIGILRPMMQYDDEREAGASTAILRAMRKELREQGFDVFESDMTFDEAARLRSTGADYLVEVIGGEPVSEDYGGLGVGGANADVTLAYVVSRVAAQLRVYDGQTLEVLANEPISKRTSALLPTSIGVGDRSFFAVFALPVAEWAQYRRVARAAAHDAATLVASAVRRE
ncbi:MAG TPA: hypothetical protein VJZ00_04870 [Thermoanaerobaculia bacterium]|nr:hypothetical protein [Thermoanaerobaculia bacterium]